MVRFLRIALLLLCGFSGISAQQQIMINEVMTANASAVLDPVKYNYSEWIELYNPGSQSVLISGYRLSNNPANLGLWKIPLGTFIPARGFLVIWMDKLNTGLHANFRSRSDNELIFLSNSSGVLLDTVHIRKMFRNVSYGRDPDGSDNWQLFLNPTPGVNNLSITISGQSPEPVFSLPGGRYNSNQMLVLTNPGTSGNIYYTTDGSEPGLSSAVYSSPIAVNNTHIIKARIIESGKAFGKMITHTFFIREHPSTIPVVSVSTDPENLWDPRKGIYVVGTNGLEGFCYGKTNWNQEWERSATFEYFSADGQKKISTDAGIKINGGCSRTNPQKSLGIYFRDKYGHDEIRYPLFDCKNADRFKSIMLRNSGNDFNRTQLQDAMMQTLIMGQMDIDYMSYTPAALYLNGEYWGVQNIREKSSADYLLSNYGLDEDSVDLLESYNTVVDGDNSGYTPIIKFLNSNNLTSTQNYNYITSRIDLESYIDYQIAEIYFANLDWPGNNIKYWKSKKPGSKWRWLLYDTDFGFGLYDISPAHNTLTFATEANGPDWPNPPWSTLLFRRLLGNDDFRKRFVDKFNIYIYSTFNPIRVNAVIDSLRDNVAAEMPYHFARWGGSMESWKDNLGVDRDFGNRRPAFMMQYLAEYFDLSSPVTLTVSSNLQEKERFSINDIVIHDSVFGGACFGNRDVKLQALSENSVAFDHWEITEDLQTERYESPGIILNMSTSARCKAFFNKVPVIQNLYINEFCAKNSTIPDEAGEFDDWIELLNSGKDTINLSGLYITNSLHEPLTYKIPTARAKETTMLPGEFKILWADRQPEEGTLHLDFNLEKSGGEIAIVQLLHGKPVILDSVIYNQQYTNYSYGRYGDGTGRWFVLEGMTPGGSNLYTYLPELPNNNEIEIFPNPVIDFLEIRIPEPDGNDVEISIYDQFGREKLHRLMDGHGGQLDVGALPPGIYVLRVKTSEGTFVHKLVKI
jgi:hypothetical protein